MIKFSNGRKTNRRTCERKKVLSIGTDERSPGGRKAGLYRLDENFSHALLLFVQEQKIFYAVSDALEKQTDHKEVCCEHGQSIVERMKEVIVQRMEQDEKIQVIVVGIPGAVYRLFNLSAAVLRAIGNSQVPFIAMLLSSITNIVLYIVAMVILKSGVWKFRYTHAVKHNSVIHANFFRIICL